jgi:hypothetical protein
LERKEEKFAASIYSSLPRNLTNPKGQTKSKQKMKKIDIYSVKSNRECMKATVKPEMQQ